MTDTNPPLWIRVEAYGNTQHAIFARWISRGYFFWDERAKCWEQVGPTTHARRYTAEHAQAIASALRLWYGLDPQGEAGPVTPSLQQATLGV